MAKPVARRISSDDCVVTSGGDEYRPHEGEWVEMIPGITLGELHALRQLREMGIKLAAAGGGDDEEAGKAVAVMDDAFSDTIRYLSRRIVSWNWTDDTGMAYEQPQDDPMVIRSLRPEELRYLVMPAEGESPTERKNGSRPL